MTTPRTFKVGDKVRAFGVNGVVTQVGRIKYFDPIYQVQVDLDGMSGELFLADGRSYPWHLKPSLKHRRFKKRIRPDEIWVNIIVDPTKREVSGYLYESEEEAKRQGGGSNWENETAVRFVRSRKS